MNNSITGNVIKLGLDNIDTDVISSARFGLSATPNAEEWKLIKENAFGAIRPELYKDVKPGDILVSGKNFGYGSHRVRATTVLGQLGFSAVIAESFARIYFRNAIAIGFPAYEVPGITQIAEEGDRLEIDLESCRVKNLTNGKSVPFKPHSDMVKKILDAGGIFEMMRQRLEKER